MLSDSAFIGELSLNAEQRPVSHPPGSDRTRVTAPVGHRYVRFLDPLFSPKRQLLWREESCINLT